jgi:hypothetical protein
VITSIPQSIIDQYRLLDLFHIRFIFVEISRGMHGLPQAGILAYNQLVAHPAKHGYASCTHTPGIWTHDTHDITLCLVVDDFGIKYTNCCNAKHLLAAQQALYVIITDWTGSLYIAMTIDWGYHNKTVDISMPGYVDKVLDRFQHNTFRQYQNPPPRFDQTPIRLPPPAHTST